MFEKRSQFPAPIFSIDSLMSVKRGALLRPKTTKDGLYSVVRMGNPANPNRRLIIPCVVKASKLVGLTDTSDIRIECAFLNHPEKMQQQLLKELGLPKTANALFECESALSQSPMINEAIIFLSGHNKPKDVLGGDFNNKYSLNINQLVHSLRPAMERLMTGLMRDWLTYKEARKFVEDYQIADGKGLDIQQRIETIFIPILETPTYRILDSVYSDAPLAEGLQYMLLVRQYEWARAISNGERYFFMFNGNDVVVVPELKRIEALNS